MEACWHQDRIKKRCQLRSKHICIPRLSFEAMLVKFGRKMEACWHQQSIKNEINFEKRFCWICACSFGENHFFHNSGGRCWKKSRSKIDEKSKSRWERILASIFGGFGWMFGGRLGGNMEPRSIPRGIEKAMEKWIASRWPKSRNKTF